MYNCNLETKDSTTRVFDIMESGAGLSRLSANGVPKATSVLISCSQLDLLNFPQRIGR